MKEDFLERPRATFKTLIGENQRPEALKPASFAGTIALVCRPVTTFIRELEKAGPRSALPEVKTAN